MDFIVPFAMMAVAFDVAGGRVIRQRILRFSARIIAASAPEWRANFPLPVRVL
jgi:hypothetical protein